MRSWLSGPSEEWLDLNRPLAPPDEAPIDPEDDRNRLAFYLRLHEELRTALAPVFDDLGSTCVLQLTVESWRTPTESHAAAMLWAPDGGECPHHPDSHPSRHSSSSVVPSGSAHAPTR